MKFLNLSDTHSRHLDIPASWLLPAHAILHGGDISMRGTPGELIEFFKWFSSVGEYKYRILIPGNHDWLFQIDPQAVKELLKRFPNVTLLQDSAITIDGVKIYGSPWQPEFFSWAFNLPRGIDLEEKWSMIPKDTDILITHGPAHGILDRTPSGEYVGCEDLLRRIQVVKPKVHLFGHIHCGYGVKSVDGTIHVNASTVNEQYVVMNQPIILDI